MSDQIKTIANSFAEEYLPSISGSAMPQTVW